MITKASEIHLKHTALIRPSYGDFGRLELGILGAPCAIIRQYAERWTASLSNKWAVAYVDADHKQFNQSGTTASLLYHDRIGHRQIDLKKASTPFTNRVLFNDQDLVFINGNHFKAKKQVLIIHPDKPMDKKLEKLTDVALVLLADGMEVPALIKEHLKGLDLPVLALNDDVTIVKFLNKFLDSAIAPLHGLVLAGGKSTRMHSDKGNIEYHGKTQREYTYHLLSAFCGEVFISGKNESGLKTIEDVFVGLGPYGGILSAMLHNPNVAWLTVACDLPYLSAKTLEYLVALRNPSKLATCFLDSDGEFPEPLVTIWEPRAYPVLLQFLSQGYSCPRKVLINSDIELLNAPDAGEFKNVNSPEERDAALKYFSSISLSGSL